MAAAVAFVLVGLAARHVTRAGYSTDEEFTLFAIRGIESYGLPLLPSNLLYDRGIAYSALAWLAGLVGGQSLVTYRIVALLCAAAALVVVWRLVTEAARPTRAADDPAPTTTTAAALALMLVAVSLPFFAVATTARFYAPFLLTYLATLFALLRTTVAHHRVAPSCGTSVEHLRGARPCRTFVPHLLVLALFCRLSHELAFTLAVIPAIAALASPRRTWLAWLRATAAIVAGLIAAQVLLFVLHRLPAPAAGAAAATVSSVDRFFLWQVLNLVQWPFDPLDFFRYLITHMPMLTVGVLFTFAARLAGVGPPFTGPQRAAHLLWIGWVLFFGVIDSGITVNYLLLPVTFMLIALAMDLAAIAPPRAHAALALLPVVMAMEQWGTPATAAARLDALRPTIAAPSAIDLPGLAARAERVACTDELACLLLASRVDRWLALDDFLRTRFIVERQNREEGVYAGAAVARSLDDLFAPDAAVAAPRSVLVIDVFKELPVGPSKAFLDRALTTFNGESRLLFENHQLRVLELSSPE
ncbi:MAG: hypothetical protein IT178_14920 [Acidobacteria bacterium]|nr:hypothetical protein [Acidobacteriota bacterium]